MRLAQTPGAGVEPKSTDPDEGALDGRSPAHHGSAGCICSSAPTPQQKWWCPGTPPPPCTIRASWSAQPDDGLGRTVAAETVTYRDAASRTEIRVHHARTRAILRPTLDYVYAALHDGADPEVGTVRTAPRGRAALRFTSFGDQSTPTLDASVATRLRPRQSRVRPPPATSPPRSNAPRRCSISSTATSATPTCPTDRVRTWSDWFENNSRSARYRPWMPAAGNHENELGNGPIGYWRLPDLLRAARFRRRTRELRGLWYAFTAGSVRVISLANDDICYQDGGNSYVRGYSGGAQKRWLEGELARTRADNEIDWIVVCMHQTAVSTGERTNGADLAIRENWLPLSTALASIWSSAVMSTTTNASHAIRGTLPSDTLTPMPVDTGTGPHRHQQGHSASGHRRRRHVDSVQRHVLPGAALPGTDGGRRLRSRDRPQVAAVRRGVRAVVDVPGHAKPLRLRRIRCRSRRSRRQHIDCGDVLRGQRAPSARPSPVDKFTLMRPRRDSAG